MKKILLYTLSTILSLVVLFIGIYILNNGIKSDSSGTITVTLVNEEDKVVSSKEIEFFEEDALLVLLEENFDNVDFSDGYLKQIGELKEYSNETSLWYISILVNGTYSEVGLSLIEVEDGMVISFEMEEYKWEN